MYTLYSESRDLSCEASIIMRTFSTLLLLAPSISIGSPFPLLTLFAKILANVVLPHPEGPEKI